MLQVLSIVGDLMKHCAAQDWEAAAGSVFALVKAIYPLLHPAQQQAVAARAAALGVSEPLE